MRLPISFASRFLSREEGGATTMALVLIATGLLVGGYAIDVGNAVRARTELQITADAVAHAALLTRELKSVEEAKAVALEVAQLNMPPEGFGTVLTDTDIVFGRWDSETRTFTPNAASRDAVQVTARQADSAGNAVNTYLMKLAGLDKWELERSAVFITYRPTCLREGFVSDTRVDIQSNNSYTAGFCIHSNGSMELNQNNYFEPGTVVSVSDIGNLELPNSGYERNEGLTEALREGSWNIRIIERIDDMIAGLYALDDRYVPAYITNRSFKTVTASRNVTAADFTSGQIHKATCTGNQSLRIAAGTVLNRIALVTNCAVRFDDNVHLEDVVIATSNTGSRSLDANQRIYIGRNDNCATGGGAQLVTMGSVTFTSNLHMYGGQVLAKQNITFTANASGIQGAAMVAGGTISGTSNMSMGFCGNGMENNFHAEYFKLVQ
jgi:Flp pilus assembly protein TadG